MTTYIRQDFLRLEDNLDEFFYSKEERTHEELIDLVRRVGINDSKKQEFCANLYEEGKITQMLDTIIFHNLKDKAAFKLGDGTTKKLMDMGFLNFAQQVHNNRYNKKLLHVIVQSKKKGE